MITRQYLENLLPERTISRLGGIPDVDYRKRLLLKFAQKFFPTITQERYKRSSRGLRYWQNMIISNNFLTDQLVPYIEGDADIMDLNFERFWIDLHLIASYEYGGTSRNSLAESAENLIKMALSGELTDLSYSTNLRTGPFFLNSTNHARNTLRKYSIVSGTEDDSKVSIISSDTSRKLYYYGVEISTVDINSKNEVTNLYTEIITEYDMQSCILKLGQQLQDILVKLRSFKLNKNEGSKKRILKDISLLFFIMTHLHIFPSVNNSIQMLLLNFLLQEIDMPPLPHGDKNLGNLDVLALFSTPGQFQLIFLDYINSEA